MPTTGARNGAGTTLALNQLPALAGSAQERQLRSEYVAAGTGFDYGAKSARSLPNAIDDVTTDFGDDLYERMLVDPQVFATVAIFKASILENGLKMEPAIQDSTDPDYELAKEIHDELEPMLFDNLETPLNDVLWNLLDCTTFGNKVAEQVFDYDKAVKDGRQILVLRKLKVKPRRATVFVVDAYMNIVGLLYQHAGGPSPTQGTVVLNVDNKAQFQSKDGQLFDLLPPYKVLISTFRPKDGDPRGTSILRAAYSPWWRKQQVIPEYLKYLAQFAGPSLIGFTPESDSEPIEIVDPTTGVVTTITPEQAMAAALQALRNSTVAAFKGGAQVKPIEMQGDGRAFLSAMAECNQEVTKAVLTQELATEEGRHMARAAAEVHQDVLDTLVRQGKGSIIDGLRLRVIRPWVNYNWGQRGLKLVPRLSLGEVELREMPALMTAIAALSQTFLDPSQYPAIDKLLGLPPRLVGTEAASPAGPDSQVTPPSESGSADPNRVKVREHTRSPRRKGDPADSQDGEQADQTDNAPNSKEAALV